MKKALFFFCLLISSTGFSQDLIRNVVKTNPFGFFVSQYQVGYEMAITDNFSAQLQVGILSGSGTVSLYDSTGTSTVVANYNKTGIIIIPELRYYPASNGCEGFYLGLSGRYRKASNTINDDPLYDRKATGGAITVGVQSLRGNGVIVDFFIGPQLKAVTNEWFNDNAEEDELGFFDDTNGLGVRLGISVGYGF